MKWMIVMIVIHRHLARRTQRALAAVAVLGSILAAATAGPTQAAPGDPIPSTLASTVPANGDVNPYGVAVVPRSRGRLIHGAVLVSNFNDKKNQAGTGTTIEEVEVGGSSRLFARIDPRHLPGRARAAWGSPPRWWCC